MAEQIRTNVIPLFWHHGGQVLDDLVHIQQATLWKQDGAKSGAEAAGADTGVKRVQSESRAKWPLEASYSAPSC
jgi:hypothetical protein